jgi:hypothetical protein
MTSEFRHEVIHNVLIALPDLPEAHRNTINKLSGRYVKIPGFRNSPKAPLLVRIKPTINAFEKHPDFVAAILSSWVELYPELRKRVFDLLISRNWELLPLEADRKKLPGFLIIWPKDETFDAINQAYHEKYPDQVDQNNEISLMTVWLSGRLPYQFTESDHPSTSNAN